VPVNAGARLAQWRLVTQEKTKMPHIDSRRVRNACVPLAGLLLLAATVGAEEASNGRYEGVQASETAVWVIDTRTGQVRKCTQDFSDQTPVCSKPSN
jgi:hypothetical protein